MKSAEPKRGERGSLVMPLYYFHLCDEQAFIDSDEALEYPNPHAARRGAVESLRDCMAHDVRSGRMNTTCFIEIEDEKHVLVDVVMFDEAITLDNEKVCPSRRKLHFVSLDNSADRPRPN